MSDKTITRRPRLIGPRKTFAIVASTYNEEFVSGLVDSCRNEIVALLPNSSIPLYRVPGAYEIPVCAEYIINHTGADVVIARGVVLQGETDHADIITRTVARELCEMAVRHQLPIINEVLLLKDEKQARARCFGTDLNRGVEAARSALSMAELFQKLHTAYPTARARIDQAERERVVS
jgi:6,7-dimethyl-8-ribityllumazine synthase